MDYCSGGSVRSLLKAGKIEEKYSAVIMREMLIALQYIHREGIIHRDIKAANVLVTKEGKIQLCDFGVAAQLSTSQYKRMSMIGTPYWMAPEVIQEGTGYDQKADVWSLGITLYEIVTGSPPFADQDVKRAVHLIPRSKPARLEGNQYSAALKEFVAKCLDEQPEERATAEELSKTRFIKNTKNIPTTIIRELVLRYRKWREMNKNVRDSFMAPNHGGADFVSDDEDDGTDGDYWDFDDSPSTYYTENKPTASNYQTLKGALSPEGSQAGTLMGNGETNSYNLSSTFHPSEATPSPQIYENSNSYTLNSGDGESHPLMELFISEDQNITSPQMSSMMMPPLPNSMNMSNSINLPVIGSSVSEYKTPVISLDIPTTVAPAPSYTPVEIEIPSLGNFSNPPRLNSSASMVSLHPVTSASNSQVSEASSISQSRIGLTSMSIPSSVTPHTPIKPIFHQQHQQVLQSNSLGIYNNSTPLLNGHTQHASSLSTVKSSARRTPSPQLAPNSARTSPRAQTTNKMPTQRAVSQTNQVRANESHLHADSEESQTGFDFSSPNGSDNSEKLRSMSVSAVSLAMDSLEKLSLQNQDLSQVPKLPANLSSALGKRGNLHLNMPGTTANIQTVSSPEIPSSFAQFGPRSHSIAHTSDSPEAQKLQTLYNQQLHLQQQLQQQKTQASPQHAVSAPSTAAERTPRTSSITSSLAPPKPILQNHSQKMKQQKEQIKSHHPGLSQNSMNNIIVSQTKFPRLLGLDTSIMLDSTSKEYSVAHFDALLGTLIAELDAIETELTTHYLPQD